MVKVVINGKEVSVYEAEASLLIEKGLASWPGEKAIDQDQNKMIVPEYQNKAPEPPKSRRRKM